MARLTKLGLFPKPIKLTEAVRGRVAYLESEIMDWIAKRIALRSVQPR
jgi:predicted DNA-binding transcriptional regulator AlpA